MRQREPFTSAEIANDRLVAVCADALKDMQIVKARHEAKDEELWAAYRARSWLYRTFHGTPWDWATDAAWSASAVGERMDRVRSLARLAASSDLTRIRLSDCDALLLRPWMEPEEP